MADDSDRTVRPGAAVVGRREHPAADTGDAEHVEEPAADERAIYRFRLTPGRQVEPLGGPGERAVEQFGLACRDLVPDRIRPRAVGEQRETAGIAHGQRAQDEAVEDREQGRVRADAERERQHGDGREARIPGDLAEAVPQILCELVHQAVPAHSCLRSSQRASDLSRSIGSRVPARSFAARIRSAVSP